MKIGGFHPFSLSDYPGKIAAVIFTQGCNFRCPFCHNAQLLGSQTTKESEYTVESILAFLTARRGKLDAVVITGGEPTLHADLESLIRAVKDIGFLVKLDTNGSRPEIIDKLVRGGLVDFIAMDIKAPLECYERLAGVVVESDKIRASIDIIAGSGIEHLFRTTVVPQLLSDIDVHAIEKLIPSGSSYHTQRFIPDHAYDARLRACATSNEFRAAG